MLAAAVEQACDATSHARSDPLRGQLGEILPQLLVEPSAAEPTGTNDKGGGDDDDTAASSHDTGSSKL